MEMEGGSRPGIPPSGFTLLHCPGQSQMGYFPSLLIGWVVFVQWEQRLGQIPGSYTQVSVYFFDVWVRSLAEKAIALRGWCGPQKHHFSRLGKFR